MSRKTVRFARLAAGLRRKQGATADLTQLLPKGTAHGSGRYLSNVATADRKPPHGPRGFDNICSRDMGLVKRAGLLASVK